MFSNFLNHHQLPFCKAMYELTNNNFRFVATEPVDQERLLMGYYDMSNDYPFCINTYASDDSFKSALRLGFESDIVITGSAPEIFIKKRLEAGKITFRYSERFFKEGYIRLLDPRVLKASYDYHTRYRNYSNVYILCASAYTAKDCSVILAYPDRKYKWGYFPEAQKHDIKELMSKKENGTIKFLWVGRFIKWKHPDKAIDVVSKIIKKGYNCSLDLIGCGELENSLKRQVDRLNITKNVSFSGPMKPEDVLIYMQRANIYLFTSDRQEGWGAVLNESMSSGCAVVADKAIGAVPFLIKDGVNGLIYDNSESLYSNVERLVNDSELRKTLGGNAYKTMQNEWSPQIATERLYSFCSDLLDGKIKEYKQGPMSKAE